MARRTFWPWRSSRPQRPTSQSPLWTGTPPLPTRTWGFGGSLPRESGPVALRYPTRGVASGSPVNDNAQLTVTALLKNSSKRAGQGHTQRHHRQALNSPRMWNLPPARTKTSPSSPTKFSQLSLTGPRLWWPAQMGKPELYTLKMEFEVDGKQSDHTDTEFGIREITSELECATAPRLFHQRQEDPDSRRRLVA